MKYLFLFLPLLGFSQSLKQVGSVSGICTDLVVLDTSLLVACKQGILYEWSPAGKDTVAVFPVETEGESGLLGVTKIGDGIYVSYTDLNFDQRVVKVGDDTLITIEAETNFPNHRGGDLETDGEYLFFSLGEGLTGEGSVFMLDTFGNILAEATGLRNPWRIDYHSGNLWITDVGDQDREEINFIPVDDLDGTDFNWPCFEGTVQLGLDTCEGIDPFFEYPRIGGTAIIGGYYRNAFVFADHYDAAIYVLREGVVDTLPGVKYLTAIDNGYAAEYSGKLYQLSFTTIGEDYIEFTGEYVCEYDTYNPFLNYRLDVLFTQGFDSLIVPGYFAADGNAANTSQKCGDKWRVNFNLPEGTWNYRVLFSRGANVAINGHSTDTLPPHGETGMVVGGGQKLEYVGERYRRWRSGERFLKFGTDSPETLLAYTDFDGTYFQGTGGEEGLLDFSAHTQDWHVGDPQWGDSLGRGMIGALNYLASEGQNAISFVLMNINGDGRNCWPFVSHDTLNRYDVSKLAQWRIVLDHAGDLGIHWQAKFGELENNTLLTDPQWKLMFRELVARFGDLPALTWNLGEEFLFAGFGTQLPLRANYLRAVDPYPNLIVFHNLTVLAQIFNSLTVRELIDGASLQIGQLTWTDSIVTATYEYNNDTTFVISNDEQGPSDWGVPTDSDNLPQTQLQVRQLNQYPAMFGGCEGWEAYYGYQTGCDDLECDDFRTRANVWRTNRGLREVLTQIPFWRGHPLPLAPHAFGGDSLLVYSTGADVELDLTGDHEVRYFDVEQQTWTPYQPFTGTLSFDVEYVAEVIPTPILGICIEEFQMEVRECDVYLSWVAGLSPDLEESNGGGWHRIDVDGTQYVDHTPSKFYRLSCGGETKVRINYDWCAPDYWLVGQILIVNTSGNYQITAMNGQMLLDSWLSAGSRVMLPAGAWVVTFSNSSEIIVVQ